MWAAFVRQFAAYAITRRGKKLFALAGVLFLCFGAALLIDMQLYLSAGFATVLACFAAAAFVVQHARLKRTERERLARKAEEARARAIAAQARLDRIDNAKSLAKSALGNAAGAAARVVTENVSAVASEAVLVAAETAEAVAAATKRVTDGAETAARAGLTPLVKGWRYLSGRERTVA